MLFNWFRQAKRSHGMGRRSKGDVFLRTVLLIGLVLMMILAFWNNSERYVYDFNALGRIADGTGDLDGKSKEAIQKILVKFDKTYRIKVSVRISRVPLVSSEARPGEIFFGLCPSRRQTVLIMPPEWEAALGEGLIYELKNEALEPYFAANDWQSGLIRALDRLFDGFMQISQ